MSAKADVLRQLADRCEREPDSRRLDCEITFAVLGDMQVSVKGPMRSPIPYMLSEAIQRPTDLVRIAQDDEIDMIPRFTESLDAAVTLVPKGCWWEGSFGEHTTSAEVHHPEVYDEIGKAAGANTPVLALCAAALRALAQQEEEERT